MEITIFDRIILLVTGLIALYLIYRFYDQYKSREAKQDFSIYYILSFAVLFVAGVLIILFGFDVLNIPFIKVVATLIPFGIAIGLINEFYRKYYSGYTIFLAIGFLLIALSSYGVFETIVFYPIFHAIAGLTIFLVPIFVSQKKNTNKNFYWVGIGGALIGIGGIALASLNFGAPLLGIFTQEVVFTILTPILFLMTLSFAYGFIKKRQDVTT